MNELLRAEHDRLTAYIKDPSTIGTPERRRAVLVHSALTDFPNNDVDLSALQQRLAEIAPTT